MSQLPKTQEPSQPSSLPPPAPVAAEDGLSEVPPLAGSSPVEVRIPTDEEIQQSIDDHNEKQKAVEKKIAERNSKKDAVMAAIRAEESSPVSQETISEETTLPLSPEERTGQSKELRDKAKAARRIQTTVPGQTLPTLSPAAREERNKQLREGIKAHIYFFH